MAGSVADAAIDVVFSEAADAVVDDATDTVGDEGTDVHTDVVVGDATGLASSQP